MVARSRNAIAERCRCGGRSSQGDPDRTQDLVVVNMTIRWVLTRCLQPRFPQGNFLPVWTFSGSRYGSWEEYMEQALRQTAQAELVEPSVPGVSWAAVLAGAV